MYKSNIHPEAKNCSVSIQAPYRLDASAELADFQLENVKRPYFDTPILLVYAVFYDGLHKFFLAALNIQKQ